MIKASLLLKSFAVIIDLGILMNNEETIMKSVSHSVYQINLFMFADLFNNDHGLLEAIDWIKVNTIHMTL